MGLRLEKRLVFFFLMDWRSTGEVQVFLHYTGQFIR